MADEEINFSGTYKFDKPINYEGETYAEVKYDLNKITAKDIISLRREVASMRGAGVLIPALIDDDLLCAALVAVGSGLPGQFVLSLPGQDYLAWASMGQLFLASSQARIIPS